MMVHKVRGLVILGTMMAVVSCSRKATDEAVVSSVPPSGIDPPTMSVEQATLLCLPADPSTLDWRACAELAERYEAGNGVPKDLSRATELAKRACDTGITGTRSPFGRDFCYGFSGRNGIKPPLGCCGEGPRQ
jgi:hypothetical protein